MSKADKFYLFAGDDYYPAGGVYDFIRSFDSPGEALVFFNENYCSMYREDRTNTYNWAHIVNAEMQILAYYQGEKWVINVATWGDNLVPGEVKT